MSAAYMKKWEEQNRTRHHHRRIQSAKSTVRKTALGNQRIVDAKPQAQYSNPSTEYDFYSAGDSSDTTRPSSSKISDYYSYEKENLPQIPLYRLLKHFSLQQYAKALISRGYGYNIAKLGTVSKEGFEEIMNDINVLPGHKVKLRQVLSQINHVCSEIIEQESLNFSTEDLQAHKVAASQIPKPSTAQARPGGRQVYRSTPKQETKKPSSAIAGRRPLSTKTNYQNPKKNENVDKPINKEEVAKNNRAKIVKLESIGADFFSDSCDDSNNDEFSLILNNIIEKYQHDEEPNKGKSFYKAPLDVQKREIQASQPEDLLQKVDKIYNNERKTKVTTTHVQSTKPQPAVQKLNVETKAKSKETIKIEPTSQKAKLSTLPGKEVQKKAEPAKTEEAIEISPKMKARVMDLLEDKLDSSNLNRDDLNLEFKKINDLYSSFDGAKMTSTIANIDIEEMCHCFACAIQKHIEHYITNVYPLGDTYALKAGKAGNETKSFKDDNKENVKNLGINKAVTKAPTETKSKTQPKPKPKEDKEEQIQEDIEYNDGDDYFIYKGKKIPIGGYDEEEDQITSDRHGSIFSKEKDDEVMHDEDDDGFYEDDFETEDNVKDLEEKPQQNEGYDEEEFNDFLRQSLRENLFDTLKRGNLPSQLDEQRLRLDQVCQTKSNIKALLEPNEEDIQEDLTEEEERPEYSEFSFTMEESQYREIELSTEELDQAQKIKRLFEKTYNEKNLTSEEYNKRIKDTVGKDTISNFCKNLMVTSKMEKEVIIVSLVYVERLIVKTGLYLNSINWKKICFTSFVLASKIWDDESFENEHFAKVFPQYTVKDINELEKVFLELIDYDLRVNGTDYAKYYFILRTFAEKNKRSFALKPMNVQVVRMLQNKVEGTAQSLKSKYSQNTNRSFM